MPRPVKCRKVCHFPNVLEFLPADDTEKKMPIVLTVDEYETIRLLDKKGYSQEQCAESMQIARTTVQRIYEIARKKIADALIDGHPLKIEGGDFIICDGSLIFTSREIWTRASSQSRKHRSSSTILQ